MRSEVVYPLGETSRTLVSSFGRGNHQRHNPLQGSIGVSWSYFSTTADSLTGIPVLMAYSD
jgi:hypothetical protein